MFRSILGKDSKLVTILREPMSQMRSKYEFRYKKTYNKAFSRFGDFLAQ